MEKFRKVKKQLADIFMLDRERVEELRQILELEQKRKISHDEADEVGRELIGLFECLANGRPIVRAKGEDHER
jgi:hypothetical protein